MTGSALILNLFHGGPTNLNREISGLGLQSSAASDHIALSGAVSFACVRSQALSASWLQRGDDPNSRGKQYRGTIRKRQKSLADRHGRCGDRILRLTFERAASRPHLKSCIDRCIQAVADREVEGQIVRVYRDVRKASMPQDTIDALL
jgi:hypothetical protein